MDKRFLAGPKRCFGNRHVEARRVNRDGRLPERVVDRCAERNSLAVDVTLVCECHRLAIGFTLNDQRCVLRHGSQWTVAKNWLEMPERIPAASSPALCRLASCVEFWSIDTHHRLRDSSIGNCGDEAEARLINGDDRIDTAADP